jgi:hypothetical protein
VGVKLPSGEFRTCQQLLALLEAWLPPARAPGMVKQGTVGLVFSLFF